MGIEDLGDDFKRVSEAAGEVGRREEFLSPNKVLSKMAHPTAWVVETIHKIEENKFYDLILRDGSKLALDGFAKFKAGCRCSILRTVQFIIRLT